MTVNWRSFWRYLHLGFYFLAFTHARTLTNTHTREHQVDPYCSYQRHTLHSFCLSLSSACFAFLVLFPFSPLFHTGQPAYVCARVYVCVHRICHCHIIRHYASCISQIAPSARATTECGIASRRVARDDKSKGLTCRRRGRKEGMLAARKSAPRCATLNRYCSDSVSKEI